MYTRGATNVPVNMYYVMHMIIDSQQLNQEKHMFYLPIPDNLVWQIGLFGFANEPGTSSLENRNLRFFQIVQMNKRTYTTQSRHSHT
jgi:hypothetical protein